MILARPLGSTILAAATPQCAMRGFLASFLGVHLKPKLVAKCWRIGLPPSYSTATPASLESSDDQPVARTIVYWDVDSPCPVLSMVPSTIQRIRSHCEGADLIAYANTSLLGPLTTGLRE